jgi:endonuclease/exonuclease/phosphatase family metal-dependent hydrolase
MKQSFSRRTFLKGASLMAALPLLPEVVAASNLTDNAKASDTIKVLTCNIRVALPEDDALGFGWSKRKKLCTDVIRKQQPDIICMQEVLRVQNDDLKLAFPNYFSFGFEGPEMDKFKEGYHGIAKNPIFFSLKRYELLAAGGYWLSETPLVAGSVSWDTARARNANWVKLKDKKTGKELRVVNVHLDHKSQPAREKQIEIVLNDADQYLVDLPQIFTGDFNVSSANEVYKMVIAKGWSDTFKANPSNVEAATVHEFLGDKDPKKAERKKIDFIFTKGGNFKVLDSKVIKDNDNGFYPSDHYFVSATIEELS